jgi:TPR repeat protein
MIDITGVTFMKTASLRWTYVGSFILFGLMMQLSGGCATESAGLTAYKRGEYGAALHEFQRNKTPEADFALGVMYCKGEGAKRDTAKGAAYFHRAADSGHAEARYNLGLLYLDGNGVPRDLGEAAVVSACRPTRDTPRLNITSG